MVRPPGSRGRRVTQPECLIPKEYVEHPVQVSDLCERCGEPRDKLLVKLMQTILRLRERLAEVDPGGSLL